MDHTRNTNILNTDDYKSMLDMVFEPYDNRTVLHQCDTNGMLTTQPCLYPEDNICHTYIMHPTGSIMGGDIVDIKCTLKPGSHVVITTCDKTRFYRCGEHVAIYKQVLTIHNNAELEYIVQENMFYNGCNATLDTLIDCKAGGRFMVWIWHCVGKTANMDTEQDGGISSKTIVLKNNRPVVAESILYNTKNPLMQSILGVEYPVSASFYISNDSSDIFGLVQSIIDELSLNPRQAICHVTMENQVIIVRMFSVHTHITKTAFTTIWQTIRQHRHQTAAEIPKIWAF